MTSEELDLQIAGLPNNIDDYLRVFKMRPEVGHVHYVGDASNNEELKVTGVDIETKLVQFTKVI